MRQLLMVTKIKNKTVQCLVRIENTEKCILKKLFQFYVKFPFPVPECQWNKFDLTFFFQIIKFDNITLL